MCFLESSSSVYFRNASQCKGGQAITNLNHIPCIDYSPSLPDVGLLYLPIFYFCDYLFSFTEDSLSNWRSCKIVHQGSLIVINWHHIVGFYCFSHFIIWVCIYETMGKYQNCHLVLKGSFWFFFVLFLVLFISVFGSFYFCFWFFSFFNVFFLSVLQVQSRLKRSENQSLVIPVNIL